MPTPININTASLDELKRITGIRHRRPQKIIKKKEEKGFPLTLGDLKFMSDIQNTIRYPLIQTGEVTLEQEEQEYRAEKGNETESMSREHEIIKRLDRYNADFDRLQNQNVLMQAGFDKAKLNEMSG